MAYHDIDGLSLGQVQDPNAQHHTVHLDGSDSAALPDASFVRDALITREGMDLHLEGPQGTVTVEGYFAAEHTPTLVAPDGSALSPALVNSFTHSSSEYAQNGTLNDESPVGEVAEFKGEATVTHADGSTETITSGTPIYQGDVIETAAGGAVNIHFIDDTSFAVSEDARLSIDEYVYDPATQSGENNFSVLKGMFVFTSGLIGRDDPDHVKIETPTGSIGIRGTIIAANVDTGEATVVEGAIVVRDLAGNEITLAKQFETAKLVAGGGVEHLGQLSAQDVADNFSGVSDVSPTLFSSINDAAGEQGANPPAGENTEAPAEVPVDAEAASEAPADANGSVDQNNDSQVDGTIDAPAVEPPPEAPLIDLQGGLGTDSMGLQTIGTTAPPSGDAGVSTTTTSTGLVAPPLGMAPPPPGVMPPPPPPPLAPAPLPGTTTQTVTTTTTTTTIQPPPGVISGNNGTTTSNNLAPVHIRSALDIGQHNVAPLEFFKASEMMQNWHYAFKQEFSDPNGDVLRFELSTNTVNTLNNMQTLGEITAWTFNITDGTLDFVLGTTTAVTPFTIEVRAIDQAGLINVGDFKSYNFTIYEGPGLLGADVSSTTALFGDLSVPNDDTFSIGGTTLATGNKIFAGNGNDTATIIDGDANLINLGDGDNTVYVTANANIDNIIIGGNGKDSYVSQDVQNKFYGMGGDDIIRLDMGSGIAGVLQTSGDTRIHMEGGDSGFMAGVVLKNNAALQANGFNYKFGNDSSGYGDTLQLQGTGTTIDFGIVDDNYIRGIERIDTTGGIAANITLGYQDVIQMTDYKNTLIIRADAGDTINFTGPEFTAANGFAKVGDNIAYNDNYDGTNSGSFDVYSNGDVTLLIEQNAGTNAANVTGLP